MSPQIKKYLKLIIKLILSSGMLYYVFKQINLSDVWDIIQQAKWHYLFIALVLFAISKLIAAFRLNKFFAAIDIGISDIKNIKLYLLGMYYNIFLPGGIGGDGYKVYLLKKTHQKSTKQIISSVFLDRIFGLFALCLLLIAGGYFLPLPTWVKSTLWLFFPLSVAIGYFIISKWFVSFKPIFWLAIGQSLLVQTAQSICALFIILALGNTDSNILYIEVFLISSIVAIIPFTMGGVGARELTFLLSADLLQLDKGISVTLSLLFYFITVLVSFSGIYYAFNTQKHFRLNH